MSLKTMEKPKSQFNPDLNQETPGNDWKHVLFEIIIKILTLGFYHIEKHSKNK